MQMVKIYPNPVKNQLNIKLSNPGDYNFLEVVSLTGQVVLKSNILNSNFDISIDLSELKRGFYILKITGKNVQTLSFLKE